MRSIYYYYPMGKELSFSYIAKFHIMLLQRRYQVFPLPLGSLPANAGVGEHVAVLHPYFYPLTAMGEVRETVLRRVRSAIPTLVGVDVADSNKISQWATEVANLADAFVVNSMWSRNAYVESGVRVPVYVVYHGLEEEWFRPPAERPAHPVLRMLHEIKQRKRPFTLLYFLWHSGWRKGADLVEKLLACLESMGINYMLIVKKMDITDPGLTPLAKYKTFIVEGKLPRDWLIDLYDLADLVLLPSRGGSFEMSGLEALGRGVPVLMPNVGPWIEYTPPGLDKWLWVRTAKMVPVLPGNTIHDGLGAEWDPEDACMKAVSIWANLEEVRARTREAIPWIKSHFSWEAVAYQLYDAFTKIVGY